MKKTTTFLIIILLSLSGLRSSAQQTMIDDVSYPLLEKLITTAKENYPRVKYYQERSNAGKANLSKQKLSWFNYLTFSYIYQPNNTVDIVKPNLFDGYQVGLFLNFGGLLQIPSEIKKAKAEYRSVVNEEEEYQLTLAAEVKRRYFAYVRIKKTLQVMSKIVQDVESIERQQRTRYEKSEISLKDYNEALVVVSAHTASKMETEEQLLSAKASLEEMLGKKLEDIK